MYPFVFNTLSVSERKNVRFFIPLVMIYGVGFAAIITFGLLWLKFKGTPLSIVGFIGGIIPLFTFVVGNLAGSIGDYTGRRRRVLATIFIICMGMVPIMYTVQAGVLLYVTSTIFLVGMNILLPLLDALLTQLFPLQKNRSFSFLWIRGLLTLGFLIGTLGIGGFYDIYGVLTFPWVGFCVLGVLLLLILWFDDSIIPKHAKDENQGSLLNTVQDLWAVPWFKGFLLFNLLYGVGNAFYFGFFVIHLENIGLTNMQIAITISLGAFTEVVMFFVGHKFVKKYRPTVLMSICAVFAPIRWILFSQFTDVVSLSLVSLLHMVTFGVHWVVCGVFIQKNVPISLISTAQNAWQSCCMFIPMAIILPISGVIYPILGENMFLIGAGISAMSLFVAVYMSIKRS